MGRGGPGGQLPRTRPDATRLWPVLLGLAFSILIVGAAGAHSQEVSEYDVKAAFLYDFSKFVSWPAGAFKTQNSPVTICVLGRNPFGDALDRVVTGKILNGRSFSVKYMTGVEAVKSCQIVFISRSERTHLKAILDSLGTSGVLTVGDTDGFAKQGVMINLFMEENRVHFEINNKAALEAGVSMSSKLLGLAKIVND
ncbi:MAG: YfiR family protein [Terriglobia bacterium]